MADLDNRYEQKLDQKWGGEQSHVINHNLDSLSVSVGVSDYNGYVMPFALEVVDPNNVVVTGGVVKNSRWIRIPISKVVVTRISERGDW